MVPLHSTMPKHHPANYPAIRFRVSRWFFRDTQKFPSWPVRLILALCICGALSASAYLLWAEVTSSPIAGCGDGNGWVDCESVASSRWASWFGVPVSFLALLIYLTMATALVCGSVDSFNRSVRKASWFIVTAAVFAAGLSAIWFISLQIFVLEHICLYCMVAHTCGLAATVTMIIASPLRPKAMTATAILSLAGLSVLVVGQTLSIPKGTHRIETFDNPVSSEPEQIDFAPPTESSSAYEDMHNQLDDKNCVSTMIQLILSSRWPESHAICFLTSERALPSLLISEITVVDSKTSGLETKRIVAIQGGAIRLDATQWPLVGPIDAKYVFVVMYDYCCIPCRDTYSAVFRAKKRFGDQLAIICLPVPLSAACNPMVKVTHQNFVDSCALAKLAVAVWRVDSSQFAAIHDWMLQSDQAPTYAAAKAKAATLVDIKKLETEIASGIPDKYITKHIEIYKRVGGGAIPKLMFQRKNIIGKFSSVEELVDLIQRETVNEEPTQDLKLFR